MGRLRPALAMPPLRELAPHPMVSRSSTETVAPLFASTARRVEARIAAPDNRHIHPFRQGGRDRHVVGPRKLAAPEGLGTQHATDPHGRARDSRGDPHGPVGPMCPSDARMSVSTS